VFVRSSLDELQCPCRDVGEAIPVASLRPIRTACKTLGGHILEHPSCGGFMPTAETTLFPAYSARSKRLLTSSVRLDNEAKFDQRPPTSTEKFTSVAPQKGTLPNMVGYLESANC